MKFEGKYLILSIFAIFISIVFIKRFHKTDCEKIVVLSDGTEIKCQYVQDYVSGFSNIKTCDGRNIKIESHQIKKIKIKY